MQKAVKGNFGYLKNKRTQVLIRTIIFFAIPLALLIAGIVTTGDKKNLLTVVAVLGCLPACKSLVNLIMYLKAKGCSTQAKEVLSAKEGELVGMYDMYFTSYKKNFAISHMVVEGKNICAYTEDAAFDVAACEEHLQNMLKQGGYKDMTIKVFKDLQKYCERLERLKELERERTPKRDDEVRIVLYDISL